MEKLIAGILNFSKIGMTKTKKEPIDLNVLANEAFDSIDINKNFEFKIVDTLPTIKGVKALYIQILSNIISNAIKFNDKEKGELDIFYNDLGNKHQLLFKDNGPGIPDEYQEKVFGILQTLDTSSSIRNTGIGLSIVKKIITNLRGKIYIESVLNKGTSFIIELPKKK